MKREKERERKKRQRARSFTQYRHKHSNRERKLFLMLKYLCLFEFIMLAFNAEQCTIVDAIAIATAQYNGCCRFCSISLLVFFFRNEKREEKKSALKWKLCNYHFKIGWIWENCSSLLNSFILIALDSVDLLAITVQCTIRTWYNVYAYRGHKWSFWHINLLLTDYTQPWWYDVEKCMNMNIGQHGCIGWINVVKKRSNSIYTCFCQEELCPFAIPNRINNWTLQTIGFKYISMKDMHSVTNGIDKWNSDVAL